MGDGEVVTRLVVLANVGCVAGSVGLGVVRAGEYSIQPVLVQDISIEEIAGTRRAR